MTMRSNDRVTFFSERIRQELGDNVRKIILFGSRARGEAREGSDYDFALVLGKKDRATRERVIGVEVEFLNRYDEMTSSILFSEEDLEREKRFPLGINIERDGVTL